MIEYIDYQKRLTCEEHIVLWFYDYKFVSGESVDYYKDFQITDSLIDEYNAPQNLQRRIQIQKVVETRKARLDLFRDKYAQQIWNYEKPVIWSDRRKTKYYIEQLYASTDLRFILMICFAGMDMISAYFMEKTSSIIKGRQRQELR